MGTTWSASRDRGKVAVEVGSGPVAVVLLHEPRTDEEVVEQVEWLEDHLGDAAPVAAYLNRLTVRAIDRGLIDSNHRLTRKARALRAQSQRSSDANGSGAGVGDGRA